MPTKKNRLSQAKYFTAARQLREAGLEDKVLEDLSESGRAIDIRVARGLGSLVSESSSGGVHYAVRVRMVALRACILVRWRITTKWDDQIEPNSYGGRSPLCKLGRQDYTETEVLNSRIEEGLRFSRGDMVEGFILATGIRPIPHAFRQGLLLPFELTFEDQFENEIRVEAELSVEWEAKPRRSGKPCGTGLYGAAAASRRVVASEDLGNLQRQEALSSLLD